MYLYICYMQILNVDLLQTVHALARKTIQKMHTCVNWYFVSPGYSRTLATVLISSKNTATDRMRACAWTVVGDLSDVNWHDHRRHAAPNPHEQPATDYQGEVDHYPFTPIFTSSASHIHDASYIN